jgi:ketosteroid isomerase-like protein
MTRILFAAAAALIAFAAPAVASDRTDILAAITKLNDGLNSGNLAAPDGVYAPGATIIDEFPPHYWSGEHAHADWAAAFEAIAKAQGISGVKLTLARPLHVNVEGDRAYVVVPAQLTQKVKGKAEREHGLWTFAMQKGAAGWQIAAWSWATK